MKITPTQFQNIFFNLGTEKLCKAISEFHKRFQDVEFEPHNIIVGCGSKELIFLAMLVFDGGKHIFKIILLYRDHVNNSFTDNGEIYKNIILENILI